MLLFALDRSDTRAGEAQLVATVRPVAPRPDANPANDTLATSVTFLEPLHYTVYGVLTTFTDTGATNDWSKLLALADVDPRTLTAATPELTARSDSDAKRAWTVQGSEQRIEAASYRGRPVWFAVIEPARAFFRP